MLAFAGSHGRASEQLYDLAAALELECLHREDSRGTSKAAMEAAKPVLDNENALQAEIDEAYNALKDCS